MKKLGELMNKFIYRLKKLKVKDKKLFIEDLIVLVLSYILILYYMEDLFEFSYKIFNLLIGDICYTTVRNLAILLGDLVLTIYYIFGFKVIIDMNTIKTDKK